MRSVNAIVNDIILPAVRLISPTVAWCPNGTSQWSAA